MEKMTSNLASDIHILVPESDASDFAKRCFVEIGVDVAHAELMSDVLVLGDKRGHFSHGLNRLPVYVANVQAETCRRTGTPAIVKETVATAFVDCKHILGAVSGTFCMELAVAKARAVGVGWVTARACNHFGIAGYYSMLAMREGMIGLCMTNGTPTLFPTRAAKPIIATNPIACAAPSLLDHDPFELDMATACVAMGKVEIACREGTSIPLGWGVDKKGRPTSNPHEVFPGGGSSPLGGTEETGSYKGSGLGCLVEILTSVLANGAVGTQVRPWLSNYTIANYGQTFIALDPACFADGFNGRLASFLGEWRSLPSAHVDKPVLVAGDPERSNERNVENRGGILYHYQIVDALDKLAHTLSVEPIRRKVATNEE